MTVRIRPGVASDAEALAALAALTFPLATTPATDAAEIRAFIDDALTTDRFGEYLADPARELLVGDAAGELVGYAMLVHGEPEDPDVLAVVTARPAVELNKFYVHPDRHGSGVAAALMRRAIDAARTSGAVSLWLGVSDENGRANRFYEKHGFVAVGTKQFRIGDRLEDDHVRERRL